MSNHKKTRARDDSFELEQWLDASVGFQTRKKRLAKMLDLAPPGSPFEQDIALELACHVLEKEPWVAIGYAKRVLRHQSHHEVANAVTAIAQTKLGNFSTALRCFKRALQSNPECISYLHNIGHLYAVYFNQPEQAEPYLHQAHVRNPEDIEIMISYAECLAGLGKHQQVLLMSQHILNKDETHEEARNLYNIALQSSKV